MAAAAVGGAIAVLLTLSSFASALCPSGYQPASPDKCFKAFTEGATFCSAQETCAKHEGRLVEGAEWLSILAKASSAPRQVPGMDFIWTGLTDLLEERGRDKAGWQWTSGGKALKSEVPWHAVEPNNDGNNQDCVVFHKGHVFTDKSCNDPNYPFICEPVALQKRPTQFIPASTDPVTPGGFSVGECKSELATEMELLDCFAECFAGQAGGCKAIYHNAQLKKCILLLHNDASMKIADPPSWRKFKSVG